MRFAAVIVAAGVGRRAGGELPKQWRPLHGRPVALWSAESLAAAGASELVVVVSREDELRAEALFAGLPGLRIVRGGAERIDSVRAGLAAVDDAVEAVLIHDAARPFVTSAHVRALLTALESADGALPALPVSDTLKRAGADRIVSATAERAGLWRAQTPQAFRRAAIAAAYAAWPAGETPTDDAAVLERAGGRVQLTPGDPMLMKLTYPEDFPMAEALRGCGLRAGGARRPGGGRPSLWPRRGLLAVRGTGAPRPGPGRPLRRRRRPARPDRRDPRRHRRRRHRRPLPAHRPAVEGRRLGHASCSTRWNWCTPGAAGC